MEKLTDEQLRVMALSMPRFDLELEAKNNERFKKAVWKNKSFWQALFLKEFGPNAEIEEDSIKWYKQQLDKKNYPQLKMVKCKNNQLTCLPPSSKS